MPEVAGADGVIVLVEWGEAGDDVLIYFLSRAGRLAQTPPQSYENLFLCVTGFGFQ
jgi:hypothetical protein